MLPMSLRPYYSHSARIVLPRSRTNSIFNPHRVPDDLPYVTDMLYASLTRSRIRNVNEAEEYHRNPGIYTDREAFFVSLATGEITSALLAFGLYALQIFQPWMVPRYLQ